MSGDAMSDWTEGTEAILYQRCGTCSRVWYFRRDFCPHCGDTKVVSYRAAGSGTVHAMTRVARAPSEALRAHAPYVIGLVDVDEGFRMMAHLDDGVRIGDRVRARFETFGDAIVPVFGTD
ncbi:MAG: DNA-binding protein [Betaproteobacteria bacterium]|nr:DNA-binding protein [Betaproteobacteria bacterium]